MGPKRPPLKGKIIFVFSDPGGAKPLLSLAEENWNNELLVISDRDYPFYKDFRSVVKIIDQDIDSVINFFQPTLIFTGTSYTSDIEKKFIISSIERNIKCLSFVDHWTNVVQRFENKNGDLVLPDQIWLVDENARKIAISQGIDIKKIFISGNPYHDWLKKWEPSLNKNEFLKLSGIPNSQKRILLYAPDPLSNVNGIEEFGFDELSVTSSLVDFFKRHSSELANWEVLVKPHPNQNRRSIEKIISFNSSFHLLSKDINTNSTIFYADIVLGFFSSILIEAEIMNKRVLRFFDREITNDPIQELHVGVIVNTCGLLKELNVIL